MGNLSVDTWRTIYDTLKKQRGTQDAADTPLGQMFALLDGYEATLRQSEAENAKLRAALQSIADTTVSSWVGDIHEDAQNEWRDRLEDAISIARAALGG